MTEIEKRYYKFKEYIDSEDTGNGCRLDTTLEEFIEGKVDVRYVIVPIRIMCSQCERVFESNMHNFKRSNYKMCRHCSSKHRARNTRKTHEEFAKEVKELVGNEYAILNEYKNKRTKILIQHNSDDCNNYKWEITPSNFLSGTRCPKCGDSIQKTHKEFVEETEDLYKGEYTILGEYKNNYTKILVQHNSKKCDNHKWEITPANFLSNKTCPECAILNKKKTHEEFVKDVERLHKDEYSVLGKYEASDIKVKIQHNSKKCNSYKWEITPNSLLSGKGCPKCATSKGELRVEKYLQENSIEYTVQKTFKECKDIKVLRFDFAVKDNTGKLLCLIEYDGEYHYVLTNYTNAEEILKNQQRRDRIKDQYCDDNNIVLIRIPYWEFDNIESILDRELCKIIKQI